MGYRYLNLHINSVNDASISCKNFVNFGPVTPEKMGLICELCVCYGKKLNISGYTGPIFIIFSPYESALGVDDRPLPRFPIRQGTLPWQSTDFGKMS